MVLNQKTKLTKKLTGSWLYQELFSWTLEKFKTRKLPSCVATSDDCIKILPWFNLISDFLFKMKNGFKWKLLLYAPAFLLYLKWLNQMESNYTKLTISMNPVHYFCKKSNFICLTRFWIRHCNIPELITNEILTQNKQISVLNFRVATLSLNAQPCYRNNPLLIMLLPISKEKILSM